MTLALVMILVFLVVWSLDLTKKKEADLNHRKKTITNINIQDELWCNNFRKVISDLEEIDNATPLKASEVMPAIESLYEKYDIPDIREEYQKQNAACEYLREFRSWSEYKRPRKPSAIPLPFKIVCAFYLSRKSPPPHFQQPELLFGAPLTHKVVDDYEYEYDMYGRAIIYAEPHQLICRICYLLTERDLYERGLNYSPTRQESYWQKSKKDIDDYLEKKKKYPWLYK